MKFDFEVKVPIRQCFINTLTGCEILKPINFHLARFHKKRRKNEYLHRIGFLSLSLSVEREKCSFLLLLLS
jgi:hypothetical protein